MELTETTGVETTQSLEQRFEMITGKSFNTFYAKYYKKLVWKIQKHNINSIDAEGIANDAFMHSLDKIHQYNPEYHYSTWLFTIARNMANQYKKDNKMYVLVDTNSDSDDDSSFNTYQYYLNSKIDNTTVEIDTQKMLALKYDETLKQISNLDEKYKVVIELADIQEKSYNEIIDILGSDLHVNPRQRLQTVKNRLHHGRTRIESNLKNKLNYITDNY